MSYLRMPILVQVGMVTEGRIEMNLVDALTRLLSHIRDNRGIDGVDDVFGPDDNTVASLINSLDVNCHGVGGVLRQPLSSAMETDLGQAGDGLRLTANLVRQFRATPQSIPALLGSIVSAANIAWEETDNVGEPALVGHALTTSIVVLAYVELARRVDRLAIKVAKEKIVPEYVAAIRAALERLGAWNSTRFSVIRHQTFYNNKGEISATMYFYFFEDKRYWESDLGEKDDGALLKISNRRSQHIASTWAEIEAALQPAVVAATVLDRWATTFALEAA